MDERGILVFAKPPRPGEVKTRLAQDVGAESAAALARAFFAAPFAVVIGTDSPGLPQRLLAADTFARTVARLREHGLTVETLPPWFDVDRVEELSRVQALLSRGEIEAPETERALRAVAIPDRGWGCR